jgi:hypothetical protein
MTGSLSAWEKVGKGIDVVDVVDVVETASSSKVRERINSWKADELKVKWAPRLARR